MRKLASEWALDAANIFAPGPHTKAENEKLSGREIAMQEATKFPRSTRTSNAGGLSEDTNRGDKPELKITLERPESIEAIGSTWSARRPSEADKVPTPMAAKDIAVVDPVSETQSPNDAQDADEALSSSAPTASYEPFSAAETLKSFTLIAATIGSLLVAAWSYSSMQDLRGQLTLVTEAKASADKALTDAQSRLAANDKALDESQSRVAAAEKILSGVKAALTSATSSGSATAPK